MSSPIKKPSSYLQQLANISLLIYPVVAHIGILMDHIIWPVCYLIIAIYINSIKLCYQHKVYGILFTCLIGLLFYAIAKSDLRSFIIFLPPVLIPCWLAFIFFGSLRTDEAVITRIAQRIEGQSLDPRHLLYTRRLTVLWGMVFLLMIAEAITLAIWAPFEVWSWWVHIGNYIIIAALFLIEMALRDKFTGQKTDAIKMFKVMLKRDWHHS